MSPELVGLGFTESQAGQIMSISSFTYLFACLLLPYTCENAPRKLQFFVASLFFAGSLVLMGPSQLLDLPESKWLVTASFPVLGICQVFVFIPIIPEMIERI